MRPGYASLNWLILLIFTPLAVLAYPISPNPLWPLTEEASLIVVAEVESSELFVYEDDWNSARAVLNVQETLKGPKHQTITVPFPGGLACPAPPRFLEGQTVVAFLDREHSGQPWSVVSLSYGTLYPRGADLDDMNTMIQAAVEIQKREEISNNPKVKRQWLVQAAALPGTRWHGLYELAPAGDPIRSYYDPNDRPKNLRITRDDQATLAQAFVEAPKIDHTLPMMLRLLHDHAAPEVDQFALGTLESLLLREEPPWWTQGLLWAVLARFGDFEPEKRLKSLDKNSWDITAEDLRDLWETGKIQLGIPDVQPLDVELEPRLPVGGSTPS